MQGAEKQLADEFLSRMDIVRKYVEGEPCTEPCDGQWLACAKEVLALSGIEVSEFASAVRALIEHGRGKHRNILLVGPANSAKTFMLKPLKNIFKNYLFKNPANDKFGWVGAQYARCMLLNDLRWTKELIAWNHLLLLLEGETVKLPAPKNFYSEDVCISSDIPIFATSKSMIKFRGTFNTTDEREDEMMKVRWRLFYFNHVFPEKDQKKVPPCAKCFSTLILC